jgi:CHASE3 domain sensor protein
MRAIDRVRQSRNPDELAAEIEPLAQSMAALSDEARQQIEAIKTASEAQAADWTSQQQQTMSQWRHTAKELNEAARELSVSSHKAQMAARRWTLKLWLGVLTASVTPILVLLIVSMIWLEPRVMIQEGTAWLLLKLN